MECPNYMTTGQVWGNVLGRRVTHITLVLLACSILDQDNKNLGRNSVLSETAHHVLQHGPLTFAFSHVNIIISSNTPQTKYHVYLPIVIHRLDGSRLTQP